MKRSAHSADYRIAVVQEPAVGLLRPKMPGVDVLRGVAVLMVITYHGFFFSYPNLQLRDPIARMAFGMTAIGWTGVNLFFVLSGFLITGILIDTRHHPNFYTRFYVRRALRILPAYFLTLLVLALARQATPNYLALCMLFLANMPGLLGRGRWTGFAPLWSLAVEEQFYLAWPWLFRSLQLRGFTLLCLTLIVVCPLLRAAALAHLLWTGDVFSKTWMIADNLAIGALLAIVLRDERVSRAAILRIGFGLLVTSGIGLVILDNLGLALKTTVLGSSLGFTLVEWIYLGALIIALDLYRNREVTRSLRWLVFFGDISYGLYLFHMLGMQAYDRVVGLGSAPSVTLARLCLRFVVANGIAVIGALISKIYVEDPILRLKRRLGAAL